MKRETRAYCALFVCSTASNSIYFAHSTIQIKGSLKYKSKGSPKYKSKGSPKYKSKGSPKYKPKGSPKTLGKSHSAIFGPSEKGNMMDLTWYWGIAVYPFYKTPIGFIWKLLIEIYSYNSNTIRVCQILMLWLVNGDQQISKGATMAAVKRAKCQIVHELSKGANVLLV